MKITKPDRGLDFLTAIWAFYCFTIFSSLPDWMPSLFGALLFTGLGASIGIWLNIRSAGYLFACANAVGALLAAMVLTGLILPDRPFSWKSITLVAVPLYCAYAAIKWAMDKPSIATKTAG